MSLVDVAALLWLSHTVRYLLLPWRSLSFDNVTDLRSAVTLENFEQNCCAKAKGQPHHQAGTKNIEEPGKNGEDCCALQLDTLTKSLAPITHRQVKSSPPNCNKTITALMRV